MRRFFKIILPFCLSFAVTVGTVRADFDINLIVNPDAEAGSGSSDGNDVLPIPGWTTVGDFTVVQYGASGGFPSPTDPGPSDRGLNFFAGGPSNAGSSASQVIQVASSDFAPIDAGAAYFHLSGYLGGYSSQGDNAVLSVNFRDGSGTSLGASSIGPVSPADRDNATGLLFRTTSGNVPVGTRMVTVNLQMTRLDGSYNDGYADDLSLIFTGTAPVLPTVTVVASDSTATHTGDNGKIKLIRSGVRTAALTVGFKTKGTAARGVDYDLVVDGQTLDTSVKTVTIPSGAKKLAIKVQPLSGPTSSPDKTVLFKIKTATDYNTGSPKKAVVTIDGD